MAQGIRRNAMENFRRATEIFKKQGGAAFAPAAVRGLTFILTILSSFLYTYQDLHTLDLIITAISYSFYLSPIIDRLFLHLIIFLLSLR